MASSSSKLLYVTLVLFLFLKPINAFEITDILSPLLSPVIDDICKDVKCGKGNCTASIKNTYLFECICEPGWKQTISSDVDDDDESHNFKFLPCVIPNCTMNYSCSKEAPAPVQQKAFRPPNETIFDPCYWSQCGVGSCNKTSNFSYNCECPMGANNLLNISSFPCFQTCELGMDCADLGISTSNGTSSSNPALADHGNHASSRIQGTSLWFIIATVYVAMALSKI